MLCDYAGGSEDRALIRLYRQVIGFARVTIVEYDSNSVFADPLGQMNRPVHAGGVGWLCRLN